MLCSIIAKLKKKISKRYRFATNILLSSPKLWPFEFNVIVWVPKMETVGANGLSPNTIDSDSISYILKTKFFRLGCLGSYRGKTWVFLSNFWGWLFQLFVGKFFINFFKDNIASTMKSWIISDANFFKLLMKGIFNPYVPWPFDKKLIS